MKIPRSFKVFSRHLLLASLPLLVPLSVIADETEIFFHNDAAVSDANVLFVLDASGSMGTELSGSGGQSRMAVMQDAFRQVMSEAPPKMNVGLMHYANAKYRPEYQWDSVKGVTFPVSPIDDDASDVLGNTAASDNISLSTTDASGNELPVRDFLADIVDSWSHNGYTPIVDSLYEAARYYRGEDAVWGKAPGIYDWAAHPASYTGSAACGSTETKTCYLEWNQCNGSEQNCALVELPRCCNWISTSSGGVDGATGSGYCENNNYSCTVSVTECEHKLCKGSAGDAKYNSPIENKCQPNYLVLMSDGKPEYPYFTAQTADGTGRYPESVYPDQVYDNTVIPFISPDITSSKITTTVPDMVGGNCVDSPNGYASGTCGPELTQFLATTDQSSKFDGDQFIQTYTVAFGMGDEPNGTAYLASLATAENGAFTADNSAELVEAFQQIFGTIEKNSFSFSSPSFSVDESNLLSHGNSVYVPVLDSNRTPLWSGNLRKFTLTEYGTIIGGNNQNALTDTGEFSDNAQDLWSTAVHGSNVTEGGAANLIPDPGSRTLWTDATSNDLVSLSTDTSHTALPNTLFTRTYRTDHDLQDWLGGVQDGMSSLGWYYDCDGNKITVTPLASGSDPTKVKGPVNIEEVTTCADEDITDEMRDTLINFTRGYKDGVASGDEVVIRKHMGDMLNTKPLVVSYGTTTLVLAPTNEGYLHAIDADTGIEQWGFMPSSLLKNQKTFMENNEAKRHVYGLDGPLTLWNFTEKDGNGDDVDKKYLFFGMRRGGYMYYAMDISSPTAPEIVWKISPSGDGGAINTGYGGLGETWSKPTLSRMKDPADPANSKYVLVFGGGYDARKEESDPSLRGTGPESGSDVYIVDALTGSLLWSLKGSSVSGSSALEHSIPGDIRVLDMDNDGNLDRLYFADTGGYIWRVDMKTGVDTSSTTAALTFESTLTKFADLGANGVDDGDRRKFFYEPDTALRLADGKPILTVSIGSGYRTRPLDTGDNDRFYVLVDENVYSTPPSDFTTITESHLASVTELRDSDEGSILLMVDKKGWYYPLPHHGEKVLATSMTFLDKIIFTTFALADADGADSVAAVCSPAENTSRVYILDLLTGKAVANLDREVADDGNGNTISTPDDFLIAGFNEILDSPQLIFGKLNDGSGGSCTESSCQQGVSIRVGRLNIPVLDSANANSDGTYSESVDLTEILPRLYWRDDDVTADEPLEGTILVPSDG
ncbi:MAG: PilC/PilY family type IV pilus protein [Thiolinea sp.]